MAEHYTLKWFDLEDTDEGGGGNAIRSICHVHIVNKGGTGDVPHDTKILYMEIDNHILVDGYTYNSCFVENIDADASLDVDLVVTGDTYTDPIKFYVSLYVNQFSSDYVGGAIETNVTDMVNIENEDGDYIVVDPSKDCSVTLEVSIAEGGHN